MFGKKPDSPPVHVVDCDAFNIARNALRNAVETERRQNVLESRISALECKTLDKVAPPRKFEAESQHALNAIRAELEPAAFIAKHQPAAVFDRRRAALTAAPERDYKALYELVSEQLMEAQAQLRYAAIREERVERMVKEVEARGLSIETDSQGNVLIGSANGAKAMLQTGCPGNGKQIERGSR